MRYEVRIQDIDGSIDVVPVWASSEAEAIQLAETWVDFVDRRPLYGQPATVTELGSFPDPEDVGQATRSEEVAHRRVSATGEELGTTRRPSKKRIAELTSEMRTSVSGQWTALRAAMDTAGLEPGRTAVVSVIRNSSGEPAAGLLITADGQRFGFVKDRHAREFTVAGGDTMPEYVQDSMAISILTAVEYLTDSEGE